MIGTFRTYINLLDWLKILKKNPPNHSKIVDIVVDPLKSLKTLKLGSYKICTK